ERAGDGEPALDRARAPLVRGDTVDETAQLAGRFAMGLMRQRAAPQLERRRRPSRGRACLARRSQRRHQARLERARPALGILEEAPELSARVLDAGVGEIFHELAAELADVGVARVGLALQ